MLGKDHQKGEDTTRSVRVCGCMEMEDDSGVRVEELEELKCDYHDDWVQQD